MRKLFLFLVLILTASIAYGADCPNERPGCSDWYGDMEVKDGNVTIESSDGYLSVEYWNVGDQNNTRRSFFGQDSSSAVINSFYASDGTPIASDGVMIKLDRSRGYIETDFLNTEVLHVDDEVSEIRTAAWSWFDGVLVLADTTACTVATNTITTGGLGDNGLQVGDDVYFVRDDTSQGLICGSIVAGKRYYVKAEDDGENFQISETSGGAEFNITDNADSGNFSTVAVVSGSLQNITVLKTVVDGTLSEDAAGSEKQRMSGRFEFDVADTDGTLNTVLEIDNESIIAHGEIDQVNTDFSSPVQTPRYFFEDLAGFGPLKTKTWSFTQTLVDDNLGGTGAAAIDENLVAGEVTITGCNTADDTLVTSTAHNFAPNQYLLPRSTSVLGACNYTAGTAIWVCDTPTSTTFTWDETQNCGSKETVGADTSSLTDVMIAYPDAVTLPDPVNNGICNFSFNTADGGTFIINSGGTPTSVAITANIEVQSAIANCNDTKLCVYDGGANARMINNTGGVGKNLTITCTYDAYEYLNDTDIY